MIITYLRSSAIGTLEFCELKYYIGYNLGFKEQSNVKTDQGTIVHKTLELLALCKKSHQDGKKTFTDTENIVKRLKVQDYLDTNDNINSLIENIYYYYSSRLTHNNWTNKHLVECKNSVYKVLGTKFDPRQRNIVDAEPHFDFEIQEPWAYYKYNLDDKNLEGFLSMKGTIDLVTQIDDGIYEIVDWKNGKRLNWATGEEKTHDKLQDDVQLRIYHYAASRLYPDANQIIITINFINDGGPFTMVYDKSDLPQTENMIRQYFEKIKNSQKPELIHPNKRYLLCDNGFKLDKCKRFCHFGKNTFAGTHVEPLINKHNNRLTRQGQPMSMCEQVHYMLQYRDIDKVTANVKKPNHDISHYHAPGSVSTEKEKEDE